MPRTDDLSGLKAYKQYDKEEFLSVRDLQQLLPDELQGDYHTALSCIKIWMLVPVAKYTPSSRGRPAPLYSHAGVMEIIDAIQDLRGLQES